ncbi:MAG: hypothetical protein P4L81_08550, partial [Candidatus Pacebacteria bacterium]|nr:hypothetical protein [Candidatus Paceibacterota bacterium]
HSFRAGVVTLMFESNASEGELHVLANLMSHDVSTAARSYHRPQYSRAAVLTNSKVANLLLQNA